MKHCCAINSPQTSQWNFLIPFISRKPIWFLWRFILWFISVISTGMFPIYHQKFIEKSKSKWFSTNRIMQYIIYSFRLIRFWINQCHESLAEIFKDPPLVSHESWRQNRFIQNKVAIPGLSIDAKLEGRARRPIFLRARKLLYLYLVSFDNLFFFPVNWALMIQTDRTKRLFNRFTKKCKIHGGRIKLLANLRQSLNCSIIPIKWNCKSDTKGSCWFVFPSIYLFLIPLLSNPPATLKNVLISMWKPFILKLIFMENYLYLPIQICKATSKFFLIKKYVNPNNALDG